MCQEREGKICEIRKEENSCGMGGRVFILMRKKRIILFRQ